MKLRDIINGIFEDKPLTGNCLPSYLITFLSSRKIAFTLAEVLITLGIIGAVAALTMPALIQNYRNSVAETRLKKFYSIMNQAILQSINDNGDTQYWTYDVSEEIDDDGNYINQSDKSDVSFETYLAPYFNITGKNELTDGDGQKRIVYHLPDGSAFAFQYGSNREIIFFPKNAEKCLKSKKVDSFGKCAFAFEFYPNNSAEAWKYLYNKGMESYMFHWDGEERTLYNDGTYGCISGNGNYCTAIIQQNGWKVPKDYPRRISF